MNIDSVTESQIDEVKDLWAHMVLTVKPLGLEDRSVSLQDAWYIYLLIRHYKPKIVLEIGTWIGTITYIIGQAFEDMRYDGLIYTCDKRNVFKGPPSYIKYYNCISTKLLKKLIKKHRKIDFCFADANLQKKDPKLIKSLFRNKVTFATHDYKLPNDKGVTNIMKMKRVCDNPRIMTPEPFELFGNKINSSVAVLEEE